MMSSSSVGGICPCATATCTSGTFLSRKALALGEVLDARADIEGLAAAIALAQQRLAHDERIERRDEGAHRQPVDRRRGDDRQLAHAGQRQLQRARDRRRGERQHMHLGAQLLEPLLVRDAEMLLLVDDQQAEVLELDRSCRAAHACRRRCRRCRRRGPLRAFASSAAGTRREACATFTGKPRKRSREGLVVLAREQRRRHDDRDLLAVHRRDEGGAQRHLGLAEADVAADQPVHRPARARDRRAPRRWRSAGPRSPRRGSGRRTRRRGPARR